MVDFKADERLNTLNHSCAHVMAQAVKHLYPHAKFWVGPVVKEGFYYDIDLGDDVVNDDVIAAIEKEMKKICKEGKKIYRREVTKAEALEMFKDDFYKLDLIEGLEDGNITVYDQGDFTDLCRGPHVDNTKLCKNFKLVKYSGVYWKGDAKNHVIQTTLCYPCNFRCKSFYVILLLLKKTFRNEQWHIYIFYAYFLESSVEFLLYIFPDGITGRS